MKNLTCILKALRNVQIISALIWASTIIACSYFSDKSTISMVLITAAGFHVILMSQIEKGQSTSKA